MMQTTTQPTRRSPSRCWSLAAPPSKPLVTQPGGKAIKALLDKWNIPLPQDVTGFELVNGRLICFYE